ncbi:LPXTG cell wall anchor domain-containing protein, partial [Fructobacillus tropaeoli]
QATDAQGVENAQSAGVANVDVAHQTGLSVITRGEKIYKKHSVLPNTGIEAANKSVSSLIAITGIMISGFFLTKKSKKRNN